MPSPLNWIVYLIVLAFALLLLLWFFGRLGVV